MIIRELRDDQIVIIIIICVVVDKEIQIVFIYLKYLLLL